MFPLTRLFSSLFLFSCISTLSALCPVPIAFPPDPTELQTHKLPFFDVSYAAGKTIGIDENYVEIGLLYSPLPCCYDFHPFVDLRAYRLQDNKWAASAGGGLRVWCDNGCSVVGVNAFYDFRASDLGDFHQAGVGFEWLSPTWQFSLNGYLPFNNKYIGLPVVFDDYIGEFTAMCTPSTYSKKGGDFEIGRNCGCYDRFVFYLGAGSYYFHGTPGNNWGAKLRTRLTVARYFAIEGLGVWDKSCDLLLQLKFSLSFPLDFLCDFCCQRPLCGCDCPFIYQPVNRNDMIILEDQCCWTGNF